MKKTFIINGETVAVENLRVADGEVRFTLGGKEYAFSGALRKNGEVVLQQGGKNRRGVVAGKNARGTHPVILDGLEGTVHPLLPGRKRSDTGGKPAPHTAPMPGTVQKVFVEVGETVEAGQKLLVMEAMKLQLAIEAAYAGTIKEIRCSAGGLVADGDMLVVVEPTEKA